MRGKPLEQEWKTGQRLELGVVQVSARMRLLLVSPIYRVPVELTETPTGESKREEVPKPSRKDHAEPGKKAVEERPAKVVTTPRGVIMRIRLLTVSVTKRLPEVDAKERWCGLLKLAEVPVPSAHAKLPLPAKVDTVPLGRMSLMRLLPLSPT